MSATMNVTDVYQGTANIYNEGNVSGNGSMIFLDTAQAIHKSISIISIIALFLIMISLGCNMEISKIKIHLFKPKGVAIAFLAQFGIMPLTAFTLAKLLAMGPFKSVTLLICGCCPGGNMSNLLSLAMKGDMNLSIVMTTCSSIAALGMMPLLLYIYCKGFPGLENAVPYSSIMTTLILALVPCIAGILINHYKPNYTPIIKKAGLTIVLIASVILVSLTSIVLKNSIWMILMPDVLAAAVLMPLTGYILGYVMSILCKLSPQCSRTISMETGCQNIQVCFAILQTAFDRRDIGPMLLFPLLYVTFQATEALLLCLSFRCYQRFKPSVEDTTYHSVNVKQEEVKQP
ncbi:hepatic sodium/bile acid cotransporter-like [Enoplosus armatus]|uniref:hepatic sodium/bile acid cotransporter-like n=1 Tax=Enoplosus armatus TaxID=215367 RepID=UPI003991B314